MDTNVSAVDDFESTVATVAFVDLAGFSAITDVVNIAARIAALASPGQLLATQPVADIAIASGIVARDLGTVALRSIADHVPLYSIELAPAFDPAWIDPVCKMHAPYEAYRRTMPTGPWFCSERCAEAYRRSPGVYPNASKARDPA